MGMHEAATLPATPREAALDYAARGWSVIPMQPRAKRPLVAWREFQHRRAEAADIAGWWRHWPEANVGIVTGQVSGLVVVDVDAAHGGLDSLAVLQARHGALPPTVECVTGGGGRHLYYAHPGGEVPNRVGLHPGIDLRGDGGCVVAPPSVHPSGVRYAWRPGFAPGQHALVPGPVHFFGRTAVHAAGHSRQHWRELVREGIPEGRRNSTLASISGHLLWRGVDPDVVLQLMLAWNRTHCRPPLDDDEVAGVVGSIARLHEQGEH